jgi:PRTRC genetic system protein F
MLTLPVLDETIPLNGIIDGSRATLHKIGTMFSDAGIMEKNEKYALQEVIKSFEREVIKAAKGLEYIGCEISITDDYHLDEYDGLEAKSGDLLMVCNPNNLHPFLHLGPVIGQIEEKHPGLGETILSVLYSGLDGSIDGYHPRMARARIPQTFWAGLESSSEYIDENELEDETEIEDVYTYETFDQSVPIWVSTPTVKYDLKEWTGKKGKTTTIVRAAQAVEEFLRNEKPRLQEVFYSYSAIPCSCLLDWEMIGSQTEHVFGVAENDVLEAGINYETLWMVNLSALTPAQLNNLITDIKEAMELACRVDHLLKAIFNESQK